MNPAKRARSTLPQSEARKRYVEIAELVVLEQIRIDAAAFGDRALAIGPFARVDAGAVAARDGKTRGAITNLFGSQAAFQAATMDMALDAGSWIDALEYPAPADFASPEDWLAAFFAGQSRRGPQHGAPPVVDYAFLWTLWLSTVPYGMWSEEIAGPSMDEFTQWVAQLEEVFQQALDHFGLSLHDGASLSDLAWAVASLIEGAWLNQCLVARHPRAPAEPIAALLQRSGRLLWLGAVAR